MQCGLEGVVYGTDRSVCTLCEVEIQWCDVVCVFSYNLAFWSPSFLFAFDLWMCWGLSAASAFSPFLSSDYGD